MNAIQMVAFDSRDKAKVFVKVPSERGRYVLTHRSVVEVACPQCKAVIGEPCIGSKGRYWADVHYLRKQVKPVGKPHIGIIEAKGV